MKQLIIIAVLAIICFSAIAQSFFTNNSSCTLEIREVCINVSEAPFFCNVVSVNSWQTVPPATAVLISSVFCSPGYEVGYEVRYAASTGCFWSVLVKSVPTVCNNIPDTDYLPSCPSCNNDPITVHALSNYWNDVIAN